MRYLLLISALVLTACTSEQRDDVTRDAARSVIRPVLADKFPGIPLEPSVDCIIDNASSRELLALAGDAITGPTAATAQTVTTIASRPETLSCLATNGLSAFLT